MAKGNGCLIVLDKVKGAQLPPTPIAGRKVGGADIISLDNNPDTYLKNINGRLRDVLITKIIRLLEDNRSLEYLLSILTPEEKHIVAERAKSYKTKENIEMMLDKKTDIEEAKNKVQEILALREKAYRERLEATTLEAKNQAQQKIVGYNKQITGIIEELEKKYIYHKELVNSDVRDIQRLMLEKLGLDKEEGWLI